MARKHKHSAGDELAVNFIVALLMMPLFGLLLLGSDEPHKKTTGMVLLVIGLIIWCIMSAG